MSVMVSELICTRLSHDIIGNIGAVANAVELLEEGDMDFLDDIKSILKTSSGVLAARLKFFRLAFGLDNTGLDNLQQIKTATEAYLSTIGGKNPPLLELKLVDTHAGKAVMLMIMSVADLLIKGGTIKVAQDGGKIMVGVDQDVRVSADKLAQSVKIIKGEAAEISAESAPLVYLLEVCRRQGFKLNCPSVDSLCFVLE